MAVRDMSSEYAPRLASLDHHASPKPATPALIVVAVLAPVDLDGPLRGTEARPRPVERRVQSEGRRV